MKKILNKLGVLGISLGLLSFVSGGDVFEIYLNGKLVHQQAMHNFKTVKTISLSQANYNDEMSIKFSHCGTVGKGRTITLKDGQDKILKQWRFEDSKGGLTPMSFKVGEILDLQKNTGEKVVKLFYSSNELPKGQIIASIARTNNTTSP